jgi:acetyl esterase/lipase
MKLTRPQIVVAGDSAGGNLCLGLMSNLLHPYSETTPLTINEPLGGLVLISPWVSCDTDTHSYRDYGDTDVAPASLLSEMGQMFVRPDDRNSWAEPYLADASWWKNIPTKKVLNLYGDSEMFKDHISKVGKDLVAAGVDIKNVVCANHIHVECILDAQTGLEHGSMADEIWDWLKTVL